MRTTTSGHVIRPSASYRSLTLSKFIATRTHARTQWDSEQ
jgi:hypothetical protein